MTTFRNTVECHDAAQGIDIRCDVVVIKRRRGSLTWDECDRVADHIGELTYDAVRSAPLIDAMSFEITSKAARSE